MVLWMVTAALILGAKGNEKPKAKTLDPKELAATLKLIDDRLSSPDGDYQARFYIEDRSPNQQAKVSQLVVYRRDADQNLMFIFTKPKTQAGQGYLRLDENLWFYDPTTGRWDRRSVRDHVVGAAIGADFDQWYLDEVYNPRYLGLDKLGAFTAHKIHLDSKPDVEAPFPMSTLWVDVATNNPLKMENRSKSGDLVRTLYFPKWVKATRKGSKRPVYYPSQVRIFRESDKVETILMVQEVSLSPVGRGVFTKAWLESQSR